MEDPQASEPTKGVLHDLVNAVADIRLSVDEAVLFEQLAEECTELSHASMKMARKIRGENYTPSTYSQIKKKVEEETADVILVMMVLNLHYDLDTMKYKLNRWLKRMDQHDHD